MLGEGYQINLVVGDNYETSESVAQPPVTADISKTNVKDNFYLNPKYTFDTFVVGNSNHFCARGGGCSCGGASADVQPIVFIRRLWAW